MICFTETNRLPVCAVAAKMATISESARKKIYGENARALYRL